MTSFKSQPTSPGLMRLRGTLAEQKAALEISTGSVATDIIWDVAGDLAVGTGANTAARLAIGTALQTLRVNAGVTALEWATGSVTTIVGITGTKAQFDTACTDGDFAYQSDLSSYATTAYVVAGYIPLATSVANRIPKRSGTTGLLTDSGITIDASDNVTGVAAITASGVLSASGSGTHRFGPGSVSTVEIAGGAIRAIAGGGSYSDITGTGVASSGTLFLDAAAGSGVTIRTNANTVNALTFASNGNATFLGTITGSNLSGTNTGDKTLSQLLPTMVGQSGKYLTNDGTVESWGTVVAPTWGAITGTLASQTDLQSALNLKAPLASPTFTGTVNTAAITASGATNTGAQVLRVAGSGGGFTRVNDNGTVVIDSDIGSGSTPLDVKYNGASLWQFAFGGGLTASTAGVLNMGGGYLHVFASANRPRLSTFTNLELCPGSLGGGGTYVEINNGTAGTYRDLKCRDIAAASISLGGSTLTDILTATATLNFASIFAGGFEDLTIAVTGATLGSTAVANPPVGSVTNNITYDAWVSAADVVTVRASNNNLITAMDPASGTFRATVFNF